MIDQIYPQSGVPQSAMRNPQSTFRNPHSSFPRFFVVLILTTSSASAFDLSGKVVDLNNELVPGAEVWLSQDRQVKHTQTDGAGAFAFSGVQAKPTEVVARKEGLALGGAVLAVVGSGTVTIPLAEPADLRLRIKTPSYEPIPGAYVRKMFVADTFNVPVEDLIAQGFPSIRSDEQGHLVIPQLPKGTHVRFTVGHRNYADAAVAYLPVREKEQTIILYPGVKLRGRVTLESGEGVGDARVTVLKIGAGAQREAADTLTDPEGFYHATVAPGEYFVAVGHPDYASPRSQYVVAGEDEDANTVNLVLQTPHVISGSVMYPDKKPCQGAFVSYWIGNDLYEEVLTQSDGLFRLQVPLEDGRLHVVPPNGYRTKNYGDIAVKGVTQPHVALDPIVLVALPVIEGVVLSEQGAPEPKVLISSRNLTPPIWAVTDTEGRFRIALSQAPLEDRASFRAEHATRFLRKDFEVSFEKATPAAVNLKPFEPDLSAREIERAQNDLSGLVGQTAPELACDAWFNSPALSLEGLRGKVVVLTFWGGFDVRGPIRDCIEELRALHDLLEDLDDVAIVCVHDSGKEPDEVAQCVKDYHIGFPLGRDAENAKTYERYGIHYIPQTVLIDKHGVLRYFRTEGRLLEMIKSLRREA